MAMFLLLSASFAAETDTDYKYWEEKGEDWQAGVCATGTEQSPIDIDTDDLTELDSDEGFNLQINLLDFSGSTYKQETLFGIVTRVTYIGSTGGAGSITAPRGGTNTAYSFDFHSFHFHTEAEHTVDGKRYDMEMHVVFEQRTKTLTRYGSDIVIYFKEGDENPFLKKVIEDNSVDWSELFPDGELKDYVYYDGGSTAFTCDETITYYIWSEVIEASEEQIEILSGQVDANGDKVDAWGNNYRAVQKWNGRKVWQWGDLEDLEDYAGALLATVALLFF